MYYDSNYTDEYKVGFERDKPLCTQSMAGVCIQCCVQQYNTLEYERARRGGEGGLAARLN